MTGKIKLPSAAGARISFPFWRVFRLLRLPKVQIAQIFAATN